jgi:hypothetical protein
MSLTFSAGQSHPACSQSPKSNITSGAPQDDAYHNIDAWNPDYGASVYDGKSGGYGLPTLSDTFPEPWLHARRGSTFDNEIDEVASSPPLPTIDAGTSVQLVSEEPQETARVPNRRGRRQHVPRSIYPRGSLPSPPTTHTSNDNGANPTKPYHCTLCTKTFRNPYSWKRHESGVHGHTDIQWICLLGEVIVADEGCIFCSKSVHNITHFDQHNIQACRDKSVIDRTFARKDLLKQHIRHAHLGFLHEAEQASFRVPDSWSRLADPVMSSPDAVWCGFCLHSLETIAQRMDHVAQHFRDGLEMGTWISRY